MLLSALKAGKRALWNSGRLSSSSKPCSVVQATFNSIEKCRELRTWYARYAKQWENTHKMSKCCWPNFRVNDVVQVISAETLAAILSLTFYLCAPITQL